MSYLQNPKIDNQATDGLNGVHNSLAYRVHEIEKHFHSPEYWYGRDATDGYLLLDGLESWTVTAGTGEAFGAAVQISDGTEIESGSSTKKMDIHRILFTDISKADTTYVMIIRYGTGTFALSERLTSLAIRVGSLTNESTPVEIMAPRIACNNKIWVQTKSQTNNETLSFMVGVHTYVG